MSGPGAAGPAGGRASGGTRHTVSPRTRSGSLLVASSRTPGQSVSSRWARSAIDSIRCSQVSRTSSSCRCRSASASVSSTGRSGSSRTPSTAATRTATSAGSVTSASSTSQEPPLKRSLSWLASRAASRVLPTPPGPHKVSMRTSASSIPRSARSRSRPTKLLGSDGSRAAAGAVMAVVISVLPAYAIAFCHRTRRCGRTSAYAAEPSQANVCLAAATRWSPGPARCTGAGRNTSPSRSPTTARPAGRWLRP